MKTIEHTALGRFEIVWGKIEEEVFTAIEAHFGSFTDFKSDGDSASFRDPLYRELKELYIYRNLQSPKKLYFLGEITNGVWAFGLPVDGN
ncbi:hypothetical protein [Agrobacterium vaccinii]|uniref:hypothetical protein n=1 Tax=Agrobacterium vaccinii TaxID=2735528 RepID=UPI001E436B3B|nr:hypothetical protein [Agrobacterium vaccinii]UHS55459.1 hypothetical protein HRS00_00780 [Agrobacterium vaccinii]